jgi:hypothetical protein
MSMLAEGGFTPLGRMPICTDESVTVYYYYFFSPAELRTHALRSSMRLVQFRQATEVKIQYLPR